MLPEGRPQEGLDGLLATLERMAPGPLAEEVLSWLNCGPLREESVSETRLLHAIAAHFAAVLVVEFGARIELPARAMPNSTNPLLVATRLEAPGEPDNAVPLEINVHRGGVDILAGLGTRHFASPEGYPDRAVGEQEQGLIMAKFLCAVVEGGLVERLTLRGELVSTIPGASWRTVRRLTAADRLAADYLKLWKWERRWQAWSPVPDRAHGRRPLAEDG